MRHVREEQSLLLARFFRLLSLNFESVEGVSKLRDINADANSLPTQRVALSSDGDP